MILCLKNARTCFCENGFCFESVENLTYVTGHAKILILFLSTMMLVVGSAGGGDAKNCGTVTMVVLSDVFLLMLCFAGPVFQCKLFFSIRSACLGFVLASSRTHQPTWLAEARYKLVIVPIEVFCNPFLFEFQGDCERQGQTETDRQTVLL